jgi:hypothetical protein
MAPRAAKLMEPAGGQVRIGILQGHEHNYPRIHCSLKMDEPEPPK